MVIISVLYQKVSPIVYTSQGKTGKKNFFAKKNISAFSGKTLFIRHSAENVKNKYIIYIS